VNSVRSVKRLFGVVMIVSVGFTACSGDDTDDSADADSAAPATVSVPLTRLTPFCQAMIDLSDELLTDPPDDPEALIIETYVSIVDDVPEQIKPDFLAVLASLQGTELPTTTTIVTDSEVAVESTIGSTVADESFDAESRLPPDESEQRLNSYVQFACRDALNNPGPPATPPIDQLDPDDENGA